MIKIYLLYNILFLNILLSNEPKPPAINSEWKIIKEGPILISWINNKSIDWCKAVASIPNNIEIVQQILEDKKNYPNVFERIEKTSISDSGNVHIVLDMPWPFAGRDYVVKYNQYNEGNDVVYQFFSVIDSSIPIQENYIRLVNATGEWRITSLDKTNTLVTYIWNGELLGDFPDFALTQAWIQQGEEVMTWLKNAVE